MIWQLVIKISDHITICGTETNVAYMKILFKLNSDECKILHIDGSAYSENRKFRLVGKSKQHPCGFRA